MKKMAGWWSIIAASMEAQAPDLSAILSRQSNADQTAINLIASECYAPRACLEAEASLLVNKNASGYPIRESIGGAAVLDEVEALAVDRAKKLFGAEYANVQAYSATIGNVAVLRALLDSGDRILAFDKAAGGHISHSAAQHLAGQDFDVRVFGIDAATGRVDLAGAEKLAHEYRPRMIIAGSSNYPRQIDFEALGKIARGIGALLFADIAHVAGLIVAGLHPDPIPFCDVVTTSTHKTLCGPRAGGLILCKAEYGPAIDAALNPGLQDSPAAHIMAGRAVLLDLVSRPEFTELMQTVVTNAQCLARSLADQGIDLYTGGTETHMVVVDLSATPWQGPGLVSRLADHHLIANSTMLEYLAGKGMAALRLGTVAMTTRGVDAAGFKEIAGLLAELIRRGPGGEGDNGIRHRAATLARKHPIP